MRTMRSMAVLVLASTALAGCHSPFLASLGIGKRSAERRPPEVALVGAQLIEEGRAQLADGRLSEAVASFFVARHDPSTAAQAENGLGVAYAKLGRYDLADRFFRSAIAREPTDMRYAANLLRLQHEVQLARRSSQVEEAPALAVAQPAPRPEKVAVAAPPVHRISDGAFHITTVEDVGPKPAMAIAFLERPQIKGAGDGASAPAVPQVETTSGPAAAVSTQKMIVIPQ